MQSAPYVSLSAELTLEKRLDSLALNVANMNTIGYRAAGVSFHTYVSRTGDTPVDYATGGKDYITRTEGPLINTGNPLDVAVQGEGWLAIQTPGGIVYTRDGRMQMKSTGELQSLAGHPILDAGGTQIILDPTAGQPVIGGDGMITQNGQQVGAIGLFQIDPSARFTRYENSGVIPDKPATPILDFNTNGIVQGHVEGSNVNPILEMAKLITIERAFESITGGSEKNESTLKDALPILGGTS
jgi:flagellar basal-body rod protein FlgF